jgi:hypothetical protein
MLLPDLDAKRRPWKRAALLLVLVGIAALVLYGRPLYTKLRVKRAQSMALAAEQKWGQKNLAGAVELAQSALQLDRQNLTALRVMAKCLSAMRREEAFSLWGAVWQGKPPPARRTQHGH